MMRLRHLFLVIGAVMLLTALALATPSALAAPSGGPNPAPQPQTTPPDDSVCLTCHNQADMSVQLASGETLSLYISADLFAQSTHGTNKVTCVTCHADITGFPHPERTTATVRDVKLKYYTSCQQCHTDEFNKTLDSVHQKALAAGNKNAAVCADCHNPHIQRPMQDLPRSEILQICARCHSTIYNEYAESVHGSALLDDDNPDVPTCIDCHGVHNISDPTTEAFRLKSPTEMCGKCHTDATIMDKYGISTDILNTYVADFHGTTVTIFEKQAPDQITNKPVCFDCHGVHSIKSTKDPNGLQVKSNLLLVCQKCHPGVKEETFTEAWLSHYVPSPDKYPIVYYVNLFYKFLIPGVLVPMGILVLMDFTRLMINRFKKSKPAHKEKTPAEADEATPTPEAQPPAESAPAQPPGEVSPPAKPGKPRPTDEESNYD